MCPPIHFGSSGDSASKAVAFQIRSDGIYQLVYRNRNIRCLQKQNLRGFRNIELQGSDCATLTYTLTNISLAALVWLRPSNLVLYLRPSLSSLKSS
ncbi:unnamed protein product [Gongylonema pulchrum]|uniref:Uncharacterized protein n=1 Tax=Gongylonema pulchrum TaxID=637853 RepID=A0A183EEG1_9BILA|nr:unnamed protein product [Gongylonema pulchrum]